MTKLQLAKDLIEEKSIDGKCTLSKKKLAEVLHTRYPTAFKDVDAARSTVRAVTNSNGSAKRKQVSELRVEWKGLALPEPEANDFSKFVIQQSRIAIMSDIHLPYYHKEALNTTIAYFRKWKPEVIILNGDIIDCYHISRFLRHPGKRSMKYEIDMLHAFLDELKKYFNGVPIVFVEGNHEQRYEVTVLQRVPEFVDLEWTKLEYVIHAKHPDVTVIKGKRLLKAGELNIGHGHEMPTGIAAPVNPARGFFLKTKANFLGGHHHQTSSHTESDINDRITGAWSTGCLCELHPHYMPINKWNTGAATVEVDKSGAFEVNNFKVINGKIL